MSSYLQAVGERVTRVTRAIINHPANEDTVYSHTQTYRQTDRRAESSDIRTIGRRTSNG